MSRSSWRIALLGLAVAMIAMAWFALNAPRLAQPSLSARDLPTLPTEQPTAPPPEAPPAPPVMALSRPLFGVSPTTREAPSAAGDDAAGPGPRGVLSPPWEVGKDAGPRVALPALDDFRAALNAPTLDARPGATRPRLSPEDTAPHDLQGAPPPPGPSTRAPRDGDENDEGEGGLGPAAGPELAARPTPNPRRDSPEPPLPSRPDPQPPTAAGETPPAVAAAATSQADPTATVDGMVLLGVFSGPGVSRALVRTPDLGAQRVGPGDEIGGWRVAGIGEDHIRLRRASQTRMLTLPGALP